ncbi:hypothetical protein ACNF42_01910 [Cuniculiplasma sp. SKW3]|uniref:hypothetical protein n=1 Tax=Cuniculiplasma sp. SKW3 TaxID=3400170 RepID=UPI003FD4167B
MILSNIIKNTSISINGLSALNGILGRGMEVLISISAIVIAILWIPIAIGFFSTDENRKYNAYEKLRNATIGTLIYVMAITGVIFGLFNFIITGKA